MDYYGKHISLAAKAHARFRQVGITVKEAIYYRPQAKGHVYCTYYQPPGEVHGSVILIHGTGNDGFYPSLYLIQKLLLARFNVFTFDLDGHGFRSSTQLHPDHIGSCISTAWEHFKAHEPPRPWGAIGHSLGGALLIKHWEQHPQWNLDRMILVSTPLVLKLRPTALLNEICGTSFSQAFWEQIGTFGLWDLIPAFGSFKRDAYPIRLRRDIRSAHYLRVIAKLWVQFNLTEACAKVKCPTLLIYGRNDHVAPVSGGKQLAQHILRSDYWELQGANHFTTYIGKLAAKKIVHWLSGGIY